MTTEDGWLQAFGEQRANALVTSGVCQGRGDRDSDGVQMYSKGLKKTHYTHRPLSKRGFKRCFN